MDRKKVASELVKLAKEVMAADDVTHMSVNEIGSLIAREWHPANYAAKPYIEAMQDIDAQGNYIADSWTSIVAYFLSNATSWRGDTAKAVKAELNKRLKHKRMNG